MFVWRTMSVGRDCNCRQPCNHFNQSQRSGHHDQNRYHQRYNPYAPPAREFRDVIINPNLAVPNFQGQRQYPQYYMPQNEHQQGQEYYNESDEPQDNYAEHHQYEHNQNVNAGYRPQRNNPVNMYWSQNARYRHFRNQHSRNRHYRNQHNRNRYNGDYDYYGEFYRIPPYIAYGNPSNPASLVLYRLTSDRVCRNSQGR